MANNEQNQPDGKGDHISKLAFTAVAAPGGVPIDSEKNSHEIQDLDQYTPKGEPATQKEVFSYYAYYAGNNGIGSFQ